MFPLPRLLNPLILIPHHIIHMRPKIIQLRLIKPRRQLRPRNHLVVLQRRAHRRDNQIVLHSPRYNPLQRRVASFHIAGHTLAEDEIDSIAICPLRTQDRRQDLRREVISLNDAPRAPDLPHSAVIDAPVVLLIRGRDDGEALNEARETGGVGGFAEVL